MSKRSAAACSYDMLRPCRSLWLRSDVKCNRRIQDAVHSSRGQNTIGIVVLVSNSTAQIVWRRVFFITLSLERHFSKSSTLFEARPARGRWRAGASPRSPSWRRSSSPSMSSPRTATTHRYPTTPAAPPRCTTGCWATRISILTYSAPRAICWTASVNTSVPRAAGGRASAAPPLRNSPRGRDTRAWTRTDDGRIGLHRGRHRGCRYGQAEKAGGEEDRAQGATQPRRHHDGHLGERRTSHRRHHQRAQIIIIEDDDDDDAGKDAGDDERCRRGGCQRRRRRDGGPGKGVGAQDRDEARRKHARTLRAEEVRLVVRILQAEEESRRRLKR